MKDVLNKIEEAYNDVLVIKETLIGQLKIAESEKKVAISKKMMADARETSLNATTPGYILDILVNSKIRFSFAILTS